MFKFLQIFLFLILFTSGLIAETVRVTGMSDAELGDFRRRAKHDAMNRAIAKAAGVQVKSHALASMHSLVAHYSYARSEGFVSAMRSLGPGIVQDGLYYEEYEIEVQQQEINRELVSNGIDVEFLYDLVERPKIAIALDEYWKLSEKTEVFQFSNSSSFSRIVKEFKRRHPGFVIRDLSMLRDSVSSEIDYVDLAQQGQFDVLIAGYTEVDSRSMENVENMNPWLQSSQNRDSRPVWDVDGRVSWRVIRVGSKEVLFTVSDFDSLDNAARLTAAGNERVSADLVMDSLLSRACEDLFIELMAQWSRAVLKQQVELVFVHKGNDDPFRVEAKLGKLDAISSQSLLLDQVSADRCSFRFQTGEMSLVLVSILSQTFDDYQVSSLKSGVIEMRWRDPLHAASVELHIAGLPFGKTNWLQRLEGNEGIASVERVKFENGNAVYDVFGDLTADDIARLVNDLIPECRIIGVSAIRIDADFVEDGQ